MSEITRELLERDWARSKYRGDTLDEIDFFIHEGSVAQGDTAYAYSKERDEISKLEILHTVIRSYAPFEYDNFDEDAIAHGEYEYGADYSCEVITDKDCYILWFKDLGVI